MSKNKVFKAKAPGKVHLVGEHSVVYGYEAIIAAIDLYATTTIVENNTRKVRLILSDFKLSSEYTWPEIFSYYNSIKKQWYRFQKTGDSSYLKIIKEKKDALILISLAELAFFSCIIDIPGLDIHIHSQIPIGGMGSSSAVSASVIRALNLYFENDLSVNELYKVLVNAETKFQGKISGGDQAAVMNGGIIKYHKKGEDFSIEHLEINSKLLKNCMVVNSGIPENLTGEVVADVRKLWYRREEFVTKVFKKLDKFSKKMIKVLIENDKEGFFELIHNAGDELIKLGIVTPYTLKIIKKLEQLGASVKVSGAGAISGKGSGFLLCFADDYTQVEDYLELNDFPYRMMQLGVSI